MNKWLKAFIGLVVTGLVLLAAMFFVSWRMLTNVLPEYSGEKYIGGLTSQTEIFRDKNGIAYIFAGNDLDAAAALGFAHAQERLFQMDIIRRAGQGRLSELMGVETLKFDRMFRTIGLYKKAIEQYPLLSPETQQLLQAYARGVNAYISERKESAGIEFDLLNYAPEPWKPEHSLVVAKMLAWELNISWWTDITFANLVQNIGAEKVKEILPNFPENAPTIIPSNLSGFAEVATDLVNTDREFRAFAGMAGTHIGSNNWVVDSSRSVSGHAIIANDPHLSHSVPGKWYVASINSPDWNATGFTLPGLPVVVIGKNNNIAWAVTNVMADDTDFYIEKIDSTGSNYLLNNNWEKLVSRVDTIFIKNAEPFELEINETHRGPIISGNHLYDFSIQGTGYIKSKLSMRWTALDKSDELFAFNKINKAGSWKEFEEALKEYTVPGQNFICADKAGNIGYRCGVKLPARKENNPTFVFDGSSTENDWKGFIKFRDMPRIENPENGFIASANNKTVKNFPWHISNLWEPPSRIQRITELLNSKEKHSVADFKKYQNDFFSQYAKEIKPYIFNAFRNARVSDSNLNLALELLDKWNNEMGQYQQAPAIFEVFFMKLLKNIFLDELGEDLFREYIFIANVPYRTVTRLLKENRSNWFNNINTPGYETRDDIIRNSIADAMTELEKSYGTDIALWQWGKLHKVKLKHLFSGQNPILDRLVDIGPFNIGGSGTTVFNTEYSFNEPYDNILGPSMRYIYDFSRPDEFIFILPAGQSGHVLSSHYKDQTEKWLSGEYITINTSPEFIKHSGFERLRLLNK